VQGLARHRKLLHQARDRDADARVQVIEEPATGWIGEGCQDQLDLIGLVSILDPLSLAGCHGVERLSAGSVVGSGGGAT
jgi:hypothetical protein